MTADRAAIELWLQDIDRHGGPKEAVHGAFFEQHKKAIVQELIRRVKDPDTKPSTLRVLLETLQATGQYLFMHKSGLVRPLIEYLWEKESEALLATMGLLATLGRECYWTDEELAKCEELLVHYLFDLVEESRDFVDERFNHTCMRLLMVLCDQFHGHRMPNIVLDALGGRIGLARTFSENLAILYNRGVESDITDGHDISYATLVTVFVARVFERKSTADLFYTNDLKVIVDTALREIQDRGDHHMLRLAHLSALYYLLVNARYTSTNHKPALIVVVMDRIIGDPLTDDDTRALAAKILHDCSNMLQLS